jgi:hypothetical protein
MDGIDRYTLSRGAEAFGSHHAPHLTQNLPGGGDIYPDRRGVVTTNIFCATFETLSYDL